MWSDALLIAERNHLLRLLLWGAASVIVSTSLFLFMVVTRRSDDRSPLLRHFAIQLAGWGMVELVVGVWRWQGLVYRDLGSYTSLDRLLWLNVGLDVGYVGVGVAIAATGWVAARRLGPVGGGLGVVVHGLALLVLHSMLLSVLARLTVA